MMFKDPIFGKSSLFIITIAALLVFSATMGCLGDEEEKKGPAPTITVVDVPVKVVEESDGEATEFPFLVKSTLAKDTMINVTNITWREVLKKDTAPPSISFKDKDGLDISRENEETWLQKGAEIELRLVVNNYNPHFRSGYLEFEVHAKQADFNIVNEVYIIFKSYTETDISESGKLTVDNVPDEFGEPYDAISKEFNLTIASTLSNDTMINISDMQWSDVLKSDANAPQIHFFDANGVRLDDDKGETFLPHGAEIVITMVVRNIDQDFRSGDVTFKINSRLTDDFHQAQIYVSYQDIEA